MTVAAESVIKPGDVFEIRAMVVEKYNGGYYRCRHPGDADEDCPFNVPEGVLASGRRVERPLAVGDRVNRKDGSCCNGTIKAADGPECWVEWPSALSTAPSFRLTEPLSNLARAPAEGKDKP